MAAQAHLAGLAARTSAAGTPPGTIAGEIVGERRERLVWEHWSPNGDRQKTAVVFLHGFGDHFGCWRQVAASMAEAGHTVWMLDLPGHGRSGGPRSDVGKLEWVLADVDRLLGTVAGFGDGQVERKPVLFGDSMGGAIAAAYAVTRLDALSGLVLSAPAVHLTTYPLWQALGTKALAAVAPRAGLVRLDPRYSTHDTLLLEANEQDPLGWHGKATARSAVTMYEAGRRALRGAALLRVPVLVLHGEDDRVVPVSSSRRFLALLGSQDKQLVTFPGFYHEIFKELGKEEPIGVLLDWLARH